jgi:DNA polymerase III subunit epsilon
MQDLLPNDEQEVLENIFPQGLVSIDLETTGLSPLVDRIIEISLVKWTPRGVEIQTEFVDPEREVLAESTAIHGITNDMLIDAPSVRSVLTRYRDFVDNLPLVAHNAKFDLGFLVFNLHQHKLSFGAQPVYCSCQSAREAFPELANYKLSTLTQALDIELESHHRAQDDAIAALKVFAKIIKRVPSTRPVFHTQDFNRQGFNDLPEHLKGLGKKVRQAHIIEIRYRGGSHKNQWRPVQCVSLLPLPHGNVLYAKCFLSGFYKSFLLQRIEAWQEISPELAAAYHQQTLKESANDEA